MRELRRLFVDNKGFTLLELIVVIAILGILSGIAVPRIRGIQDKARFATGEALLANIKTPLELYRVEKGHYPEIENGQSEAKYSDLQNKLNNYIANFDSMLPYTSENDWSFGSYSYVRENDSSYTLEIEHPKVDQSLQMTTAGIKKVD